VADPVFLDAAGRQVGPVHANFASAIAWAAAHRWRDLPAWFTDARIEAARQCDCQERGR
jgi:hypothetical protein